MSHDQALSTLSPAASTAVRPACGEDLSPDILLALAFGFAPPLMIAAAVRVGLFDWLALGPATTTGLALDLNVSARGLRALCHALAGLGLLQRVGDNEFDLTPLSATYLVRNRPRQNLGMLFTQAATQLIPAWIDLETCLSSGRPYVSANQAGAGEQLFTELVEGLLPLNWPAASRLAAHLSPSLGESRYRVLDIAAGSAVWSIPFAMGSRNVEVTAIDWARILPITRRVCQSYGVERQYSFVDGDVAEADFGCDYDLALLGHILHSEGEVAARRLLRRVHETLRPGAQVVIAEFLVDDDRSGPISSLIFALNMFVHTDHGDAFSYVQLENWLTDAGFTDCRQLQVDAPSPLILATKP